MVESRRGLALAAALGMSMSASGFVFLLAARPVDAAAKPSNSKAFGTYAMTVDANALTTNGDIGASGGLVGLDSGQASISGRLDSTPSASLLATPVRAGSFAETVVGQLPSTGTNYVKVPQAEAEYPGTSHGSLQTLKPTKIGPMTVAGGNADAEVTKKSMKGSATGAASGATGVFLSGASTVSAMSHGQAATASTTVSARTADSQVNVGGVFKLENVDAKASIAVHGSVRKVVATVTVGGASVAGQPVTIGPNGVKAVGHGLLPGTTTAQLTAEADKVLKTRGISVHAVRAIKHSSGRSSYADTGGIQIDVATPNLPAGIAGNTFTITLGSIVLTETDAAPVVIATPPVTPTTSSPSPTPTVHKTPVAKPSPQPRITTTVSNPPLPATGAGHNGGGAPPVVASPSPTSVAEQVELTSGGLSRDELLAAFAGWQFLSLMTPTLYALASSRRARRSDAKVPR